MLEKKPVFKTFWKLNSLSLLYILKLKRALVLYLFYYIVHSQTFFFWGGGDFVAAGWTQSTNYQFICHICMPHSWASSCLSPSTALTLELYAARVHCIVYCLLFPFSLHSPLPPNWAWFYWRFHLLKGVFPLVLTQGVYIGFSSNFKVHHVMYIKMLWFGAIEIHWFELNWILWDLKLWDLTYR